MSENKTNFLSAIVLGIIIISGAIAVPALLKNDDIVIVQPADNGRAQIDSIYKEQIKSDSAASFVITTLSQQVDSLKKANADTSKALNKERKKVLQLSVEVDNAKLLLDTSAYFKYCDELSAEVKILDNTIEDYKLQVDSLNSKNYSLVNLLRSQSVYCANNLSAIYKESSKQSKTIDSLNLLIIKATNKRKHKYTVGVGSFGGLHNKGFGGGVGIVVSKTVFSF
jgi:hypothetical protein